MAQNIFVEDMDGYTAVRLHGSLNSEEHSEELRLEFKDLKKKEKKYVLVDFTNVSYINSSAIRGLLSGNALVKKMDGRLALYNLNEYNENIIKISNLHLEFKIFKNLSKAVHFLKTGEIEE
ncbi:MAG: STAS domain-containing protein [Candidatus Kapaibacterium sp.]